MHILITGGTGSLGSLLVEHYTQYGARIRVVSRDPHKQAALLQRFPKVDARLGDIRDYNFMLRACRDIDVVVHAAALKRIERGETDPLEYFSINTQGSDIVASAIEDAGVGLSLLISSDKSVDATSTYGLTKRMAEKLWLQHPGASCLRYGNVMDSVGSFWWAWNKAVADGERIQVREPEPTRFFLIRKEAIALVDDAIGSMLGHEILIPKDMYAVSMHDIARELQDEKLWIREPLGFGEKQHESLIGVAEHAVGSVGKLLARVEPTHGGDLHYTSQDVPRLTGKQVVEILRSQT
jgi:UDP-N-acetylglucosamine 4,6-dehydratase/5-epimerase